MHHNILISALKNVQLFFETKNWNIKPDTLTKKIKINEQKAQNTCNHILAMA